MTEKDDAIVVKQCPSLDAALKLAVTECDVAFKTAMPPPGDVVGQLTTLKNILERNRITTMTMINDVLTAVNDEMACWLNLDIDPAQHKENLAYNKGVSAAQEAAVKVFREYGFDVQPRDDNDDEENP